MRLANWAGFETRKYEKNKITKMDFEPHIILLSGFYPFSAFRVSIFEFILLFAQIIKIHLANSPRIYPCVIIGPQ